MKTLALLIVLLISTVSYSQNVTGVPTIFTTQFSTWVKFEPKTYLAEGKVGTLNIEVRNYDVYQVASSKQYYVNVTNSAGYKSRKYLGYKFGGIQEYEGNTIFFNSDTTKCWIWTVDRYGQLYKMNMPDYFTNYAKAQQ